jgi:hypothetical protein
MGNDENFDVAKLMELRDEMLAASAAADKHMEESDRLFRAKNDAESRFSAYARGGQQALDEHNQAIAQMAEQDRMYQRGGLAFGRGAGGQYTGSAIISKGRLS